MISAIAADVLAQYTLCEDAKGKTVAANNTDGLVVFTDKTYLPAIIFEERDYGDILQVSTDLAINDLHNLGLLSPDIVNRIEDEEQQLAKIGKQVTNGLRLSRLRQEAFEHGYTLSCQNRSIRSD